jgi:hypothetical protein
LWAGILGVLSIARMTHRYGEERMTWVDERGKEEDANEDWLLFPLNEARQSAVHGDRDLGWKDGSVDELC